MTTSPPNENNSINGTSGKTSSLADYPSVAALCQPNANLVPNDISKTLAPEGQIKTRKVWPPSNLSADSQSAPTQADGVRGELPPPSFADILSDAENLDVGINIFGCWPKNVEYVLKPAFALCHAADAGGDAAIEMLRNSQAFLGLKRRPTKKQSEYMALCVVAKPKNEQERGICSSHSAVLKYAKMKDISVENFVETMTDITLRDCKKAIREEKANHLLAAATTAVNPSAVADLETSPLPGSIPTPTKIEQVALEVSNSLGEILKNAGDGANIQAVGRVKIDEHGHKSVTFGRILDYQVTALSHPTTSSDSPS